MRLNGACDVMIATDLAQRGLDIPFVRHVINYDLPDNIDDYIHRIGRTGRIGNRGSATSYITTDLANPPNLHPTVNVKMVLKLIDMMNYMNQSVPQWLKELATKQINAPNSDCMPGRNDERNE